MKQIAVTDPGADLETLVREVEVTGEDIVLTRNGKPAARLKAEAAFAPKLSEQERLRMLREMIARRDARSEPIEDPNFDWRAAVNEGRE